MYLFSHSFILPLVAVITMTTALPAEVGDDLTIRQDSNTSSLGPDMVGPPHILWTGQCKKVPNEPGFCGKLPKEPESPTCQCSTAAPCKVNNDPCEYNQANRIACSCS